MENVLIIEEVLCVLNEERIKVKSTYNEVYNEYHSQFVDRKIKLRLGKRMNEEFIKLETIESLIRKIKTIKP